MRYSSALVLSTLAVGQVAAGNARHASFHARRQAEAKRNMEDVDWNAAVKDVNWSTLNWDSIMASPTPAPTPAAKPEPEAQPEPKPSPPPEPAPSAAAPKPEPTPKKPADAPESEGNAHTESADFVSDVTVGLKAILSGLGALAGTNAKSAGQAPAWIGGDGKYKATFNNDADDDCVVFCWTKEAGGTAYGGMNIGAYAPVISAAIPGGKKLQISFAESTPMVCAPAFPDTVMNSVGQLGNTWLEMNWGPGLGGAVFDVSREVHMGGNVITAKGSLCTSGMVNGAMSCTFACTSTIDGQRCGKGGDYDIFGGDVSSCQVGKDPYTQDPSGGCSAGSDGEHLQVTLSSSKDWA